MECEDCVYYGGRCSLMDQWKHLCPKLGFIIHIHVLGWFISVTFINSNMTIRRSVNFDSY